MTNGITDFVLLGFDRLGHEVWNWRRQGLSIMLVVQDSGWGITVRPVDQSGPHRPISAPKGLGLAEAMRFCEERTNEELLDLEEER